ncbi:prepilin peptidase [Sporomusa sphaeroides]|uniref:Prepilin type IV endopeptidase peptidase domain-containing protein n=1 Tax=Sporomusa sphaeroides DSM 2875 TaxID=1337886 RepID=A0A1U7MA28_9FIRM|nr:hypothetical protein [Sporomusa sphaeroides]OLS54363.1 hypothetical protein SPSPH_46090 [Sporomusa sphaeroides DSM 2875]CVK21659.1 hypothetical protein SSPH_04354 [Sporomusa sphaeroides DSM 2875]
MIIFYLSAIFLCILTGTTILISSITWLVIYNYVGFGPEFILYASFTIFTIMIMIIDYLTQYVYHWMIFVNLLISLLCQFFMGKLLVILYDLFLTISFCFIFIVLAVICQKIKDKSFNYRNLFIEVFGFGDVLYILLMSSVLGVYDTISVLFCASILAFIINGIGNTPTSPFPFCHFLGIAIPINFFIPGGFLSLYVNMLDYLFM